MRKVIVIIAVVAFFVGLMLTSCGGSHPCPAYGKADTQKVEKSS